MLHIYYHVIILTTTLKGTLRIWGNGTIRRYRKAMIGQKMGQSGRSMAGSPISSFIVWKEEYLYISGWGRSSVKSHWPLICFLLLQWKHSVHAEPSPRTMACCHIPDPQKENNAVDLQTGFYLLFSQPRIKTKSVTVIDLAVPVWNQHCREHYTVLAAIWIESMREQAKCRSLANQ